LRVLYGELELFHPQAEAAIYAMPGAPEPVGPPLFSDHERDVHALRVLVSKASDLDRRLKQVGEAAARHGIELGFPTDDVTAPKDMQPDAHVRGRADALLLVLRARGIVISESDRMRVLSCVDGATINRWLERAAVSRSASEVFLA
jgi:hypothetical protein